MSHHPAAVSPATVPSSVLSTLRFMLSRVFSSRRTARSEDYTCAASIVASHSDQPRPRETGTTGGDTIPSSEIGHRVVELESAGHSNLPSRAASQHEDRQWNLFPAAMLGKGLLPF